jgi:glycosyltransferase involved in cell wall biosynthesis
MRGCDVVVLPSIWWENSPVVIQEARRNRVPIVCSNIGGMAEKVRDRVDGLHFQAGSAASLADAVYKATDAFSRWPRFASTAPWRVSRVNFFVSGKHGQHSELLKPVAGKADVAKTC